MMAGVINIKPPNMADESYEEMVEPECQSESERLKTFYEKSSEYRKYRYLFGERKSITVMPFYEVVRTLDEQLDYRRVHLIEVFDYNHHYSDDIMDFLNFELDIEMTIRGINKKWNSSNCKEYRSTLESLKTKDLGSLKDDVTLVEIKCIYNFENSESRFDECEKLIRKVELDEFYTSLRTNQLIAECSLIKAIIIKRKSRKYKQGSECSRLLEVIAENRLRIGDCNCTDLLTTLPDQFHLIREDVYYMRYLDKLKHHFEFIDDRGQRYKLKDVNSYQTIDGLTEKAKTVKNRELKQVFFCLDRNMPGIRTKWIDLLYHLGGRVVECCCKKQISDDMDDVFHVSRDHNRYSANRTEMKLMDTTITVVIEDLI